MNTREITFRGLKADGSNEWVYGNLLQSEITVNDTCRCAITEKFADDYSLKVHEVIPSTVGQFTGLTDKNGTRIYRGDKLKTQDGYFCTVVWDSLGFAVKSEGSEAIDLEREDFYKTCEVIGNIHQK